MESEPSNNVPDGGGGRRFEGSDRLKQYKNAMLQESACDNESGLLPGTLP